MKAISLWQPWASLWLSPAKIHETRHWATSHRGWLLVHAAKRFEKDFDADFATLLRVHFGVNWARDLPRGALIGKVNLIACMSAGKMPEGHEHTDDYQCGDFSEGRFAWRRGGYLRFATPIPYVGRQGFFDVPDEIVFA